MKHLFLAVSAALALSSCAGTRVVKTNYASGALQPSKIFIKPFGTEAFTGDHGTEAERAILESQGGREFANILKEELEKLAPTTVLGPGERPDGGWLVTGELEVVNGGCPWGRAFLGHVGVGRSQILVHVKVIDADHAGHRDAKDSKGASSNTLYDFDVAGGSKLQGHAGTVMASGLGYATPFDYRNAAERIGKVLNPDVERYGARSSASIR
jgi:hypothetical protein